MAPTLVREPFDRPGWIYEEKVDGWRMVAYKDGGRVRLVSRHGVDHTKRFSDVAAAIAKLSARTLVLDGEVAIYDQELRSRFDWLREPRSGRRRHAATVHGVRHHVPRRRELTARPLRERRARLEDVIAGSDLIFPVRRLAADGLEAWRGVVARGYEGFVAKEEASVYEGGPTQRWLKVKVPGRTDAGTVAAAEDGTVTRSGVVRCFRLCA
jgi:bifunctional non-homologous end joining protein LigD